MSIKRSKPKVDRRATSRSDGSGFLSAASKQKEPTWQEAVADQPDNAFTTYSMSQTFAKGTLLSHPTFGKGIVLSLDDRKMEVLFADSKKTLAMGMTRT